jgi:hypothetical protein
MLPRSLLYLSLIQKIGQVTNMNDATTAECYAQNGQFHVYDLPNASFSYTPMDFVHACDSRELLLSWMCNEQSEKRLGCVIYIMEPS